MTAAVNQADVADLIRMAKMGDAKAGPYLVSLCGGRLARYVRLCVPGLSTADQEDICERSIERAVRNIESFDSTLGSFDSWVRGYARYLIREHVRGLQVYATDPAELPERGGGWSDAEEMENPSLRESLATSYLNEKLSNLSETDQMIIRLRDYEQLSYDGIAELLDVQPAACRQRHARALARLRKALNADLRTATMFGEKETE